MSRVFGLKKVLNFGFHPWTHEKVTTVPTLEIYTFIILYM